MKNKQIIIITPWFGEFAGGAEVLARSMAQEFNRRGITTTIFTTCCKSPYSNWWEDHYTPGKYEVYGIKTHRFATNKISQPYNEVITKITKAKNLSDREMENFFIYGINSDSLVKELAKYTNTDYEIIALPYFHGLTYSVIKSYPNQISLIPCFHNESQFYWKQTESLIENSKSIFFNSPEEKELAIQQYGTRIGRKLVESTVTGIGVELKNQECGTSADTPIHKLPAKYFLYIGRKERGKNVHILCEWFQNYINNTKENIPLVFIGGGDTSLLGTNKHLIDLGFMDETQKQIVIKGATALINLSENESFALVIMEAWLLEKPVVVSNHCAVTREATKRANGGLCVKDKDEFVAALKYLSHNPETALQFGMQGKEYVETQFSFDEVLIRYLTVLF